MVWLIKLFGLLMVAMGAIYLVKPAVMKNVMKFWTKGKRLYLGGFLSFLLGIIFLFSAARCALPWYVVIIGIIALVKGVLSFVLGKKKVTQIVDKWTHSPVSTLRVLAIIVIVLGALLVYAT